MTTPFHIPQHKSKPPQTIGEVLKQDQFNYEQWKKQVEEYHKKEDQNSKE